MYIKWLGDGAHAVKHGECTGGVGGSRSTGEGYVVVRAMLCMPLSTASSPGVTSGCGVVTVCVCMVGMAGAASGAHESWRASNSVAFGLERRSPGREQPPEFDTNLDSC